MRRKQQALKNPVEEKFDERFLKNWRQIEYKRVKIREVAQFIIVMSIVVGAVVGFE